jgi:hypothetical protein
VEVHNCVAHFSNHNKLHEFGAKKPISWAKLTRFDFDAINFTLWSHILSTVGDALIYYSQHPTPHPHSKTRILKPQHVVTQFDFCAKCFHSYSRHILSTLLSVCHGGDKVPLGFLVFLFGLFVKRFNPTNFAPFWDNFAKTLT